MVINARIITTKAIRQIAIRLHKLPAVTALMSRKTPAQIRRNQLVVGWSCSFLDQDQNFSLPSAGRLHSAGSPSFLQTQVSISSTF